MRTRFRLSIALLASVVGHGLLIAGLVRVSPVVFLPQPRRAGVENTPVEVMIVQQLPPAGSPAPAGDFVPRRAAPRPNRKAPPPAIQGAPPTDRPTATSEVPSLPSGGAKFLGDTPRALSLVPVPGSIASSEETRSVPVAGGSRLHRELEEASSTLSEVLTTEARTTESLRSPAMVGLAARHVLEAKASGDHRNIGHATPGANAATRQYSGARDLQRNAHSLQILRSFADGASTPVWTLRVQLQRLDGRPVVELQESSGSSEVDAFAVRHIRDRVAPGSTGREPLVPAVISQAVWQVEVYVNHRQPVGPMNPLEPVGLVLTIPLTGLDKGSLSDESLPLHLRQGGLAMTFAFDETTGAIEVINLAAPQYRLKVRLLEASTDIP